MDAVWEGFAVGSLFHDVCPQPRGLQRNLHDVVHKNDPTQDLTSTRALESSIAGVVLPSPGPQASGGSRGAGEWRDGPVADRARRGGRVSEGSAGVVELGYTAVLRTAARKGLGVRIPPPALATPPLGRGRATFTLVVAPPPLARVTAILLRFLRLDAELLGL